MAKKQAKKQAKPKAAQPTPTFEPRKRRPKPFWALLWLVLGLLMAVALADYTSAQNPEFFSDPPDTNLIGTFGLWFAYTAIYWLGICSWLTVLLSLWLGYMFLRGYARHLNWSKLLSWIALVGCTAIIAALVHTEVYHGEAMPSEDPDYFPFGLGGWVGQTLYDQYLREGLGPFGNLLVFGVLTLFVCVVILVDNVVLDVKHVLKGLLRRIGRRRARRQAAREAAVQEQEAEASLKEAQQAPPPPKPQKRTRGKTLPLDPEAAGAARGNGKGKTPVSTFLPWKRNSKAPISAPPFEPVLDAQSGAKQTPAAAQKSPEAVPAPALPEPASGGNTPAAPKLTLESQQLQIHRAVETRKARHTRPQKSGDYVFPPLKLLSEPPLIPHEDTAEMHQHTADTLLKTLEEFGVKVTMGEVHAGPVITRYDLYPAPGVRVEKISNLDKNIALALKATSVRILAPVPGKGCVGIEVPNAKPQSVYIRDILESEDWQNQKAEIPIVLGKEVSGKPLITDLTRMPHLLIAGATGSGKTVCINAVITSLLYHASPQDLRFVMVDPKIVEMQVYNSLPHMLIPVVTEPKKVPNALKYLLNEMERRYQIFAQVGVRNIAGYNTKMARNKVDAEAEARVAELDASLSPEERAALSNIEVPRQLDLENELPEKLPYIVCIVDELADLMMVAPADIETGIARLAQLARAAGIHLILATQRPSVNVITGVIKANLPSRIAFKVASKVDSRTILDTMGADHLIGKGDMLFLPPGSADLLRAQGAFVADDEINRIVAEVSRHNGEPVFDEQFQKSVELGVEDGSGEGESDEVDWEDNLIPQAIEVIKSSKRASTSMLQRRLKIGYNRAARIMEMLEAEGMVGPENGSSPREILFDTDS